MQRIQLKILFLMIISLSSVLAKPETASILHFKDEKSRKSASFLSDFTDEIMRRSSSSTKILSLNLSNLILILILKAIVYGTGYFRNHTFKGRENFSEDIFTEGETALALGYFIGEDCFYRAACEVPHTAKKYLGAAEIVFEVTKLIPQLTEIDEPFQSTVLELQKAVNLGLKGNCPSNYNCKEVNLHRFLRPQ